MTASFAPREPSDISRLVDSYPLCWIVTGESIDRLATPLPLLAERDGTGAVRSLLGHIPLAHPQCTALKSDPRASVLCLGPQAYVSPRLVSNPTWGPTWNYAACRFEVEVEFVPSETDFALLKLSEALEGRGAGAWRPERMGPRYEQLKKRIVAFRAQVREAHARFKLGQDESDATFEEIVGAHADRELADWMRRART